MSFWRKRRLESVALLEAEERKAVAEERLRKAKETHACVSTKTAETERLIRENHVRKHLQSTFRRGIGYGT